MVSSSNNLYKHQLAYSHKKIDLPYPIILDIEIDPVSLFAAIDANGAIIFIESEFSDSPLDKIETFFLPFNEKAVSSLVF